MPCCEPYPGKTILFMSDWLYTAGVERKMGRHRDTERERAYTGKCVHKNRTLDNVEQRTSQFQYFAVVDMF